MNYDINSLNTEQKNALFALEGAVLVTAGAGSGKTRLLTHRIAYLLSEKHISPESILAITFTNKAANEMKERVSGMVDGGSKVWISTFHSMCVRILRRHISLLPGYTEAFSIYSGNDTDRVIKKVIAEMGMDEKDLKKKVDFHISNIKNSGKNPNEYAQQHAYDLSIGDIIKVFYAYERELKNSNALDFDDLLIKTHELFVAHPSVLQLYQHRFKYILVDEFQDTNHIQYKLVKMLSGFHKNVFVVGDEDQSIYSWRGAEFENIFRFTKDFEGCQTFKLQQNYRSTKTIIDHANQVIKNNKQRFAKTLYTNNNQGEKVVFKSCYDEQEEAAFVAQTIIKLIEQGARYSDFAVLCRLNALTVPFEQIFLSYNIPHRLVGGFKFFERLEIKNIVSFLRIMVNPKDENSLLRILNFPKRGIGDAAIGKVREAGKIHGFDLLTSVLNIASLGLSGSYVAKFEPFANAMRSCLQELPNLGIEDFIVHVVKRFAIKQAYATNSEEDQNRIMNIDAFIVAAADFERDNTGLALLDFLESISLISDIDSMTDENNAVTIATVHAMKGLEFKHVFIVALEEKCFPITRTINSNLELEEERRLMYVAVTRAEERLFLSACRSRFMYGKRESMVQSRFVGELGLGDTVSRWQTENRKYESIKPSYGNQENNYAAKPIDSNVFAKPVFSSNSGANVGTLSLNIGMMVEHPRFGIGQVEQISGDNVEIAFEGFGRKTLIKHLAPLSAVKEDA